MALRRITGFVFITVFLFGLTTMATTQVATAQPPVKETAVSLQQPPTATLKPVCPTAALRALVAGDSWAQYMWDDASHNDLFDKYGHADKQMVGRSLGADPGAGYTGPAYAVSGSEARQWADTTNYPYIANIVAELQANPTIDTMVLSIGGNDFLAGRPDGGWYKDMDLDVPGSEAALFATVENDTLTIINAALAVNPNVNVLLSSYDYPNFNVGILFCWIYACSKRADLSRDPNSDLITDAELNGMMVIIEQERIQWTNGLPRVAFDNGVGLMHYYYGDGQTGPGLLPFPGQEPPTYAPFPGGNPLRPSLRETFRLVPDPIHLDYDGYRYKISNQIHNYFLPHFRPQPTTTFFSQGGTSDGWTNGTTMGTEGIYVGDDGTAVYHGLLSFDTSPLPERAVVTEAALYLLRNSASGPNPFGGPASLIVDVASGSFGAAEVELGDGTAVPTAADVGCAYGSVASNDYALRVDLQPDGLAAINQDGTTQFRLAFPTADPNPNHVVFKDGDALLAKPKVVFQTKTWREHLPNGTTRTVSKQVAALPLPSLATYMGSNKPFLDVDYCLHPETAVVSISESEGVHTASWSADDATSYELWTGVNTPYIPENETCETASNCSVTTETEIDFQGIGSLTENYTYTIVGRNSCGGISSSVATRAVAEFDFSIVAGGG